MLNLLIESSQVRLTRGEVSLVSIPSASGAGQEIARCDHCQVAVWSYYGSRKNISFIRAGTLDHPAAHPPDVHIFTSSMHPWVKLPSDTRCFEEFYSYREHWPAASFKRLKLASEP